MSTSTAKGFAMRLCKTSSRGFTLVELVAVLIITSILALVALPRFYKPQAFDARIQYDQALSVLHYAQKIAIAQHRDVRVLLSSATMTFCFMAADRTCTSIPVPAPTWQNDGSAVALAGPTGVIYSASSAAIQDFYFSALGKPFRSDDGTPLPLTLPNSNYVDLSLTEGGVIGRIYVEPETGYVHP
jgi:MSHA pilin protein MshC